MNAFASPAAYGQTNAPLRSPRGIEYDTFVRVTRALTAAAARQDAAFGAYVQALHDNQRLWRALAADLARKENALPAPLKAQLFALFRFTAQHSARALKKEVGVEVLIDINTAVMKGLRGEVGA